MTKARLEQWIQAPRVQLKKDLPGGAMLVLECAKGLEAQASIVLEMVARMPRIENGTSLQLGPSFLRLKQHEQMFFCFQPAYMNDPDDEIPDLTLTCLVLGHQVELSLKGNFHSEDAFLMDALMLSPGGLKDDRVLLRKNVPEFEGHTGLYLMGISEIQDEPSYKPVALATLLKHRPSVLMACGIPNDSIAQFLNEDLVEIVDGSNQKVC